MLYKRLIMAYRRVAVVANAILAEHNRKTDEIHLQ